MLELNEGFGFQLISERPGPTQAWVIAGPTCDSIDRFTPRYQLPIESRAGDRLQIMHLGAYCNACACAFNGFPVPTMKIYDSSQSDTKKQQTLKKRHIADLGLYSSQEEVEAQFSGGTIWE